MKHLLTLTLVTVIGFAVVGCNKTEKVNAGATASQCDGTDCDPSQCEGMKAGCDKMGTDACPMGSTVKPAATTSSSCCDNAAASNVKPAAVEGCDPANCTMEDCDPAECSSAKVNPAAASTTKDAAPAGCPMHQE